MRLCPKIGCDTDHQNGKKSRWKRSRCAEIFELTSKLHGVVGQAPRSRATASMVCLFRTQWLSVAVAQAVRRGASCDTNLSVQARQLYRSA
jgi:hypothetical protein